MPTEQTAVPTLQDHLAEPLRVGTPDVRDALYGPPAILNFVSFAPGRAAGVAIKELDGGASVSDLLIVNGSSEPVLLYEGEEVLGPSRTAPSTSPCSCPPARACASA